ncbi:tetratricopeptide repeat protein [Desulfatibacillum aliphaticivorans]|uniref:tetratricopeptide repeat protein n=1 Tax=Desulfatibacillum aliphaticivorans TaxID=218208 RepID=UPI000488AAEC|nr:tetratricopeptide repeat protein [Desulfatibacillum aliphaticivorans]
MNLNITTVRSLALLALWCFLTVLHPMEAYPDAYADDFQNCFFVGATPEYTISCLTEMLKYYPENADILAVRGYAYFENGDLDNALRDLDRAIGLTPTHTEALKTRARLKRKTGDEGGALEDEAAIEQIVASGKDHILEDLDQEILNAPQNAKSYLNRAFYKANRKKDYLGAVHDFDAYLNIVGKEGQRYVLWSKASALKNAGKLQSAIDVYTECIELHPSSPNTRDYELRAIAKQSLGDETGYLADMAIVDSFVLERTQQVEQAYTNSISNDPDNPTLYFERAQLRKELEDWEGVLADAAKALELFPSDYYQPHVLWCRNLKNEAEKEVSYIGKTPEEVYYMKNKDQIESLNSTLSRIPDDHMERWLRSYHRWHYGDFKGAIEDISIAVNVKPKKSEYQESVVEFKGLATDILSADSSLHLIWWARGKLKWLLGDFEGAIEDMEQAVSHQPEETLYLETLEQMKDNAPRSIVR